MKIAFACDHAGYLLKDTILEYLKEKRMEVLDLGTDSKESVDYPDYGKKLGLCVSNKEADLGILVCGTGIGISLACNKVKGIRAACVSEPYSAKMARLHNDCNVISFGSRVIGDEMAKMILDAFLFTSFEGGRHQRRVDKIMAIEE